MSPEEFFVTLLRVGELAFSATVVGLTGSYLYLQNNIPELSHRRFVYAEVVAAFGIVFSLLFLFRGTGRFVHFPMDFILFVLLITAFALIAKFIVPLNCGSIWDWRAITGDTICQKLKTDIVFCFLAAIFFFVSGLLGLWLVFKRRNKPPAEDTEEEVEEAAPIPWYHRDCI